MAILIEIEYKLKLGRQVENEVITDERRKKMQNKGA